MEITMTRYTLDTYPYLVQMDRIFWVVLRYINQIRPSSPQLRRCAFVFLNNLPESHRNRHAPRKSG